MDSQTSSCELGFETLYGSYLFAVVDERGLPDSATYKV